MLFVLSVAITTGINADNKAPELTVDELIDKFLSEKYLDAGSCDEFLEGRANQADYRKSLLSQFDYIADSLLERFETTASLSDIQNEWLYSLLEEGCASNPELTHRPIEDYPGYYSLIAACRTLEGMQHLGDEASELAGTGGFDFLIELMFEGEASSSLPTDEESRTRLRELLIYLSIDGEHYGALELLLEEFEEAEFFLAFRLMDVHEKKYFDKPYLTREYANLLKDYLGDRFDSHVLGMVLGIKDSIQEIKDFLLKFEISGVDSETVEKYDLVFLWFIELQLEREVLEEDVIKNYLDFAVYNKIDALRLRKMLAVQCSKELPESASPTCELIVTNPSLKPADETEICIILNLTASGNTWRKN